MFSSCMGLFYFAPPMDNVFEKGLNVTCSGLTREEKAEVKSLVERMAGVYSAGKEHAS